MHGSRQSKHQGSLSAQVSTSFLSPLSNTSTCSELHGVQSQEGDLFT